jgi:signal transduction histidine kinase
MGAADSASVDAVGSSGARFENAQDADANETHENETRSHRRPRDGVRRMRSHRARGVPVANATRVPRISATWLGPRVSAASLAPAGSVRRARSRPPPRSRAACAARAINLAPTPCSVLLCDPVVNLSGAVLAVVAVDDRACDRVAAPLRIEGAIVQMGIVNASALSALSAPGFDAVVLVVGDEPERFVALAASLRDEPRTQGVPIFALTSPGLVCERLAGLGMVCAVCGWLDGAMDGLLIRALGAAVVERRTSTSALAHARRIEDRLRSAFDRLQALRSDARALNDEARVLCGAVVGFAANLRDGIAGPLDALQSGYVAQILDAANDTAALIERFGGAARAHTDMAIEPGSAPPGARRVSRRTLLDMVDLTRATLTMFEKLGAQKSIMVELEAPGPVSLWGDVMQLKQVVTNLLVNSLKFTPAGGRVIVGVRTVTPRGTPAGPFARQHAELIVSDTGPGIPAGERERVFERGVRLARDERVPGTGIGLAVVREIVSAHGGGVRAEEAPGGGATMIVSLPLDMRARREQSILLVDDPNAARRVLEEVRSRPEWRREAIDWSGQVGSGLSMLASCKAIVVVPRGSRTALEELLGAADASAKGDA